MLFLIILLFMSVWVILLLRKKLLSLHSVIAAYVFFVSVVDALEILFNLLLNRYKFPTHLLDDPILDNQLGIIFTDTLILPFTFIVFIHYALRINHWKISVIFTLGFVTLESIYLLFGNLVYIKWSIIFSAIIYFIGFKISAFLSKPLADYDPPIPYPVRLYCFTYTVFMWTGAIVGMPVLKLYQFKTGLFKNYMADDRIVDLFSGAILAMLCAIVLPRASSRLRPWLFSAIAAAGVFFGMLSHSMGWLIYNHWNHFFTALRYIVPIILVMLYHRWEFHYNGDKPVHSAP